MSNDPSLHLSGVIVDPQGLLSVIVDGGAAFDARGQDICGDNFLVKLDTASAEALWRKSLTEQTHGVYGGYQDALYQFNVTEELGHMVRVHLQGNQTSIDGTIVLRSTDGLWTSAEVLRAVPNIYGSQNGSTVDSLEIGGSLYSVTEWFRDDKVQGSLAGNRTQFALVDITKDVLALLK
ncbi:hypothetical protein BDV33DRAFT_210633 [Aspergillus novoparasiticus]|uniref:Uncharacterized protein n=1 Tax=Aspergillus novoparasiticus TaxID=986946 RepID=A0A5N6E5Z3_9EURO|nr:hypothetical protein BDV33DRAFT_210633 [Aspergillus novoparasiticus]